MDSKVPLENRLLLFSYWKTPPLLFPPLDVHVHLLYSQLVIHWCEALLMFSRGGVHKLSGLRPFLSGGVQLSGHKRRHRLSLGTGQACGQWAAEPKGSSARAQEEVWQTAQHVLQGREGTPFGQTPAPKETSQQSLCSTHQSKFIC